MWHVDRQGELTNDMFIIIEGTVKIERNKKPLGKLRELDIFGEMGVLLELRPGCAPFCTNRLTHVLLCFVKRRIVCAEDRCARLHRSAASAALGLRADA
jgi:CRP-like cAMP-binding protein